MDTAQRFEFDLNGVLVIRDVLPPESIRELRSVLVHKLDAGTTGRVRGSLEGMRSSMLHWDERYRELLDLPQLSPILEDLIGEPRIALDGLPSFRIDHVYSQRRREGDGGTSLHGGREGSSHTQNFEFRNGRFHNGLVVVAFELEETVSNGGGLCCCPGSHKSNIIGDLGFDRSLKDGASSPLVQGIRANAGDVTIFTEALLHGTLPWKIKGHDRLTCAFATPAAAAAAPAALAL